MSEAALLAVFFVGVLALAVLVGWLLASPPPVRAGKPAAKPPGKTDPDPWDQLDPEDRDEVRRWTRN